MTINGHLDLFSGIGGFSLALEKVGIKPNWIGFSDIDKYANELFQRRFKNAEQLGDVSRIKLKELPKDITLLTGGFPCQPFSIAGSRLAFEDTRGTLFYEIVRILKFYIQEGRPIPYIVLENVKGLYSAGNRSVFPAIYKILTDIGYTVECELLNSKFFGVPQNRERIYFVGRYSRNGSRPKVFPIREDDKKIKSYGEKKEGKFQITNCSPREFNWRDVSPALCARDYKDPKWVKVADYRNDEGLRVRKEFISPCLPARRTSETDPSTMPPLLVKQIGNNNKSNSGRQPYQQDRVYDDEGISPALSENKSDLIVKSGALRTYPRTTNPDQDRKEGRSKRLEERDDDVSNAVTTHNLDSVVVTNPYNGKTSDKETGTLGTSCGTSTGKTAQLVKYGIKQLDETLEKNELTEEDVKILDLYNRAARDECVPLTNANHMPRLYNKTQIRRLTPIECERLQGFPDNWTDGQSDTQRYKQCGNAITVNVAEVIFNKLFNNE